MMALLLAIGVLLAMWFTVALFRDWPGHSSERDQLRQSARDAEEHAAAALAEMRWRTAREATSWTGTTWGGE